MFQQACSNKPSLFSLRTPSTPRPRPNLAEKFPQHHCFFCFSALPRINLQVLLPWVSWRMVLWVEVLTPNIGNVTLFRSKIFVDNQIKLRSLGWALLQYGCCPYWRGDLDVGKETLWKYHMRVGFQLPQAKELQRLLKIHQKHGERHGTDSSSQCSEGTNPANTLILDI